MTGAEQRMVTDYVCGSSLREVAAQHGCTVGRVRRVLTAAGVTPRRVGARRVDVDVETVLRLWRAGFSERAIARHVGVSCVTVHRRLVEVRT